MQKVQCDVAVVGGGLGGLAMAAGLLRRGYNTRLYEASNSIRTETGTSLSLGENAFSAVERLYPNDLAPALKAAGTLRRTLASCTKPSKDAPLTCNTVKPFAKYYAIRWAAVQSVLAAFVPPEIITCNHRAIGYTEDSDCVRVHFKDQPDVTARLVIAADGLRSGLRGAMIPNDPGPVFLGDMNWNAVYDKPNQDIMKEIGDGGIYTCANHEHFNAATMQSAVGDCGNGWMMWHFRIASETPIFTDPARGSGLGIPGVKARLEKYLMDAGWELPLRALKDLPEDRIFERSSLGRVPLDEIGPDVHMYSPGNRVVLIGDAAHGMHSYPGQGARTAFEDADTLMQLLEKQRERFGGWQFTDSTVAAVCASDHAALRSITAEYEDLRLERMCRLQRYANEGSGFTALRLATEPAPFSKEEWLTRVQELNAWMAQYPENPKGDPASKYWKPLAVA